jgi:hypothetical protein
MLPGTTTVACALLGYIASLRAVAWVRDAVAVPPKSRAVRAFAFGHNLALAAFSAFVAYSVVPDLVGRIATNGLFAATCAPMSPDAAHWQVVFYYSKYYEFVDTWIVVLSHRRPSFLQTFHHVGIVVCMHWCIVVENPLIAVATACNACVHAVMYVYYALASIGMKPPGAKYITRMQLAQFLGYMMSTSGVYVSTSGVCADARIARSTYVFHAYTLALVALFARFYAARYKRV